MESGRGHKDVAILLPQRRTHQFLVPPFRVELVNHQNGVDDAGNNSEDSQNDIQDKRTDASCSENGNGRKKNAKEIAHVRLLVFEIGLVQLRPK